ncbi:MAG: MBL fold metallo-hydrolase [Candidatus Thorarchaeota archaeon]
MPTLNVKKVGTGFLLKYGDISLALDTGIKGETTLLSHSHADHIGGLKKAAHIIATSGTFDTWGARGNNAFKNKTVIRIGNMFGQIGVNITALNAGHVLDSTMFYLEFDDGLKVLYTGDFNNVDSFVHKAAVPVEADVLITEATYGKPEWIFPERQGVYANILDKATEILDNGRIPLFNAYSLGKAQEAIALLQSGGFRIVSGNTSIDKVCSVYNNHGVDLRHYTLSAPGVSDILEEGAVVVSSSIRHTLHNIRKGIGNETAKNLEDKMERYSLSGWTLGKFRERGFPLSAHTDFNGLVDFTKAVNPRITYVFTGNASEFSEHLAKEGINAVPLE